MSLTQDLRSGGPVARWWDTHCSDVGPLVNAVQHHAHRPTRPYSQPGDAGYAAKVGGIVGRLIERAVEPAPPYAAIWGAGEPSQATLWPTHANLPAEARPVANQWRPTPAGMQHLVPGEGVARNPQLIAQGATLENDPAASVADRATAAAAFTAAEQAYRTGGSVGTVDDAAILDGARVFRDMQRSLQQAQRICGGRLAGHAAPVMAPHWADGDVLLRNAADLGGGHTLVEVKTVSRTTLSQREETVRDWVRQLISYAACDEAEGLWQISHVALWLPRQDVLIRWALTDALGQIGLTRRALSQLAGACEVSYRHDAAGAGWQLA